MTTESTSTWFSAKVVFVLCLANALFHFWIGTVSDNDGKAMSDLDLVQMGLGMLWVSIGFFHYPGGKFHASRPLLKGVGLGIFLMLCLLMFRHIVSLWTR